MPDPIRVEIDDRELRAFLARFSGQAGMGPALREIGEVLAETTKQRFASSRGPDGTVWAPNSDVTLLRYVQAFGGLGKRRAGGGRNLTAKGTRRLAAKKPLIGETRSLSSTITYQVAGDSVTVGTPMIYGGVQQFGAKKRQFGGKAPWGDIPARPFLGISLEDRGHILRILGRFLGPR